MHPPKGLRLPGLAKPTLPEQPAGRPPAGTQSLQATGRRKTTAGSCPRAPWLQPGETGPQLPKGGLQWPRPPSPRRFSRKNKTAPSLLRLGHAGSALASSGTAGHPYFFPVLLRDVGVRRPGLKVSQSQTRARGDLMVTSGDPYTMPSREANLT